VGVVEPDKQGDMEPKTDPPIPVTNGSHWTFTKEKVLFFLGIILVIFEFFNAEVLDRPFHIEFLIAALALCGVSIAQWGDKR
jgi:hypothetical protein